MMSLTADQRSILEAAIQAPSGENCQPWKFKVHDAIELYIDTNADTSAYSWGQRASYVAVGAALENMLQQAAALGYMPNVLLFPDGPDSALVARVELGAAGTPLTDTLAAAIPSRVTNRKPYAKTLLSESECAALITAGSTETASVVVTPDRNAIQTIGVVGGVNETVMLSNKQLHSFFFSHVSWTKAEDDLKKVGFFIDTLELPPPAKVMFLGLKHWSFARLLNLVGFNRIVGSQNGATNACAGGVGVITLPDMSLESAVEAGRALQRVWLTATTLGLSLQPLTGTLYLYLQLKFGDRALFTQKQAQLITDAYQKAATTFAFADRVPFFMFRVGRGEPPTARASRFTLEEALID